MTSFSNTVSNRSARSVVSICPTPCRLLLLTTKQALESSLSLAPSEQPNDQANYKNDKNYYGPNSGLEDISDYFTASQSHRKKKPWIAYCTGFCMCETEVGGET